MKYSSSKCFIVGELHRLLHQYCPMCLCLQHVGPVVDSVGDYHVAVESPISPSHLRVAILLHRSVTFKSINLSNTPFQTVAIRICFSDRKPLTLCSFYNQPSCLYDLSCLNNLISCLPEPFLLGDFNAHSPLWGSLTSDTPGRPVEHLLLNSSVCCLNDGSHTYYSPTHNTHTSVDLTLASANIVSQFDWAVLPDRFTSDHYPIILTPITSVPQKYLPHYNVTKADWISFGSATSAIAEFQIHSSPQDNYEYLFNFITSAAD